MVLLREQLKFTVYEQLVDCLCFQARCGMNALVIIKEVVSETIHERGAGEALQLQKAIVPERGGDLRKSLRKARASRDALHLPLKRLGSYGSAPVSLQ